LKGIINVPGVSKSELQEGLGKHVPTSRTINGKPLSEDIKLNADDLGIKMPEIVPISTDEITSLFND